MNKIDDSTKILLENLNEDIPFYKKKLKKELTSINFCVYRNRIITFIMLVISLTVFFYDLFGNYSRLLLCVGMLFSSMIIYSNKEVYYFRLFLKNELRRIKELEKLDEIKKD